MNKIVFEQTGQTLRHVPMGVASSATFLLEDLLYSIGQAERVITSGAATVASWTLTTTAVAGPTQTDGTRISVSATTGATVGAPALIVAPDGTRELLKMAGVAAGSYVEAASSLAGVYPVGSTVYGVLMTASVPDAFAADEDLFKLGHPIRVTWVYTLDGVKRRVPELVEWVRHDVAADGVVGDAVLWLSEAFPDCRERIPDHADFDAMAKLMATEVANDLRARRIPPERFLVGDRGRALLCKRILAHLADLGWAPGAHELAQWTETTERRYAAALSSLTVGEAGLVTAETSRAEDTSPQTPSQQHRSVFMKM